MKLLKATIALGVGALTVTTLSLLEVNKKVFIGSTTAVFGVIKYGIS